MSAKTGSGITKRFSAHKLQIRIAKYAHQIQIHNLRQIGAKTAKSCKNHPKSSFATILRLLRAPSLVVPLSTKTHKGALKTTAQSTGLAEYVRKTLLESQNDSVSAEKDQIEIRPNPVEIFPQKLILGVFRRGAAGRP